MSSAERRRLTAFLIGFVVVGMVGMLAVGAAWQRAVTERATPDWTVAACSEWGPHLTDTATLPAYTYTDRCATRDGVIFPQNLSTVEDFGN